MGFLIAAALVTGGLIWAATRKPSGGAVAAAAPARPAPLDSDDITSLHRELERGFMEKAGVKFTALGHVFVDAAAATITIDLADLSPADARKILSVLPAGKFAKGYGVAYVLPKAAPTAKVGSDLDVGGLNDGFDVGGGDWEG